MLTDFVKEDPKNSWQKIVKYLGPPYDIRAFRIKQWLRGSKGLLPESSILEMFDSQDIWKWVDADIENRAGYLATFIPPILVASEKCLARELLIKYGDRKDVRDNFTANYSTEGWSGSMSEHYHVVLQELESLKCKESNCNIIRWIDEYSENVKKQIEWAKLREERED